ncbi:MAG: hypothetical protein D6E12_00205 [Desulfovibrio sp.]|nr:MAG: hypothetical protein D6E12_00205 [Desulfovibrio sp.]
MKTISSVMVMMAMLVGLVLCGAAQAEDMGEEFMEHDELMSEAEIRAYLQQTLPEALPELDELKAEYPLEYNEILEEYSHEIRYWEEIRVNHPEAFARSLEAEQLEYKSFDLGEQIFDTQDPAQRDQLTAELRTILERIFDLRMAEAEFEVQAIEQELQELTSMLETRRQHREQIIDRRLAELAGDHDAMVWW